MASKTYEKIQRIILVLVVACILLFFVGRTFPETTSKVINDPVEQCHDSIKIMSEGKKGFLRLFTGEKLPFECETNWYGKLNVTKTKTQEQKKEVFDHIAPLLADCWYQFDQGKGDPFADIRITDESHCFLCSRFIIDYGDISSKSGTTDFLIYQEDLEDYFKVNEYKRNDMDIYYSEYLKDAFIFDKMMINSIERSHASTGVRYTYDSMDILEPKTAGSGEEAYAIMLFAVNPDTVVEAFGVEGIPYHIFMMSYKDFESLPCEMLQKKQLEMIQ